LGAGFHVVASQCFGLLQMIPTGPRDYGAGVAVAPGTGMDDPALFRHVEFAAQFPPVGFLKIARAIFGRPLGGCRLLCQKLGLTRFGLTRFRFQS